MKKLIIPFLLLCTGASAVMYKTLQEHSAMLYNNVNEYVTNNSTQSSADVLTYVNSSATDAIFNDALTAGYSRDRVLFETYQQSLAVSPKQEVIIDGLHDAVTGAQKKEGLMDNIVRYSMFGTMGAFSIMSLGLGRFFWTYFRTDRKILNHYKANAHRYVTGNGLAINTNSSIATNNSASTETNPLVPEPFF